MRFLVQVETISTLNIADIRRKIKRGDTTTIAVANKEMGIRLRISHIAGCKILEIIFIKYRRIDVMSMQTECEL